MEHETKYGAENKIEKHQCPFCKEVILESGLFESGEYDENGNLKGLNPCPHLLYIIGNSSDVDGFGYVRKDYAEELVKVILEDSNLNSRLNEEEIEINKDDISKFLSGKYEWFDEISSKFYEVLIRCEKEFFPHKVVTSKKEFGYYSGVEFGFTK
jgi:hypothetical protein